MGDDGYNEVRRITYVKRQPEEGKLKRWVVNPVMKVARFKVNDSKKDRVSA